MGAKDTESETQHKGHRTCWSLTEMPGTQDSGAGQAWRRGSSELGGGFRVGSALRSTPWQG